MRVITDTGELPSLEAIILQGRGELNPYNQTLRFKPGKDYTHPDFNSPTYNPLTQTYDFTWANQGPYVALLSPRDGSVGTPVWSKIGLEYIDSTLAVAGDVITFNGSSVVWGAGGGGGGGTYTVNNGLTENPANNFQLGGSIIQNTTLTSNSNFIIDRTNQGTALQVKNTFSGATNSKDALYAETTDGLAGDFFVNGNASQYLNTNIQPIIRLRRFSQSGSANGIAGSVDFWLQNIPSVPISLPGAPANRLVSKWEVATTNSRFSRFEIHGQTAGTTNILLSLRANGEAVLNQYGINTFAGTPTYALGVDAVGNVVEFTPSGGGGTGTVTSVALTLPNPTNPAFSVSGSPITSAGTFAITANGIASQYIDGTGALQTFPTIPTGSGDMLKSVYDVDNDGVVDSAERVEIIVRNSTGSTLTKGQIVYLSGATGNRPNALLADASTEVTSSKTIGMVVANITNNSDGYVAVNGTLHDLNTNSFTAGDTLWLDTTPGGIVANTPPAEPNHAVFIGYVARAHPTLGRIVLKIQNGFELNELHGVLISSETNNDLLVYETSSTLWKNKSLGTILGGTTSQYVRGDGSLQTSATTFGVTCDGQGGVVTTGLKNYIRMPFNGTITGWSIISSISGSAVFDVWKSASGLPTVANTITGSAKPTLTANTNVVSSTLTGWNTSVVAGDYIGFNLDSCSICVWLILQIYISKT